MDSNAHQELQLKYNKLVEKVRMMLEAQQAYFKSNKNYFLLKTSKAIESEVNAMINPKPSSQTEIDWLGQ